MRDFHVRNIVKVRLYVVLLILAVFAFVFGQTALSYGLRVAALLVAIATMIDTAKTVDYIDMQHAEAMTPAQAA